MVVVAPLRCLLICAVVLPLAAETLEPVRDLRLSISAMPTPMVDEDLSNASGSSTYAWKNNGYPGGIGARMELGWWQGGALKATSPITSLWMVGINFSAANITPDSYEIGDATAPNNRQDLRTQFRQYGIAAGYGLATMPTDTDLGDLHWELLPILRGGYGTADTVSPGLNPTVANGHGLWWEGSLEGGLALTADNWVFNPFIGVAYGKFTTSIDLPNATTSDLTITTFAPLLGVRVGGSF
jgi:hypothetical protein